jgi:hypothetical protein
MNAALQIGIPAELKRHIQGKACLTFAEIGPELFCLLADLTAVGLEGDRFLKYV